MTMERAIQTVGFGNVEEYFLKLVLPIISITVGMYFFMLFFLRDLPFFAPYLVLLLGVAFIFVYPILAYEKKKQEIHESIHLFITYMGTISTLHISRAVLFQKLAQKKDFKEISRITEKILYFARGWNIGFAKTCRKIARLSPSKLLEDFLDRFAAALDFGEDLEEFLVGEQDALLDDFETSYKKSLKNIETFQEVFLSMTVSFAFGMATSLMLPLIVGTSIISLIKVALLAILFLDAILIVAVKAFVPEDKICHDLKIKDDGMKLTEKLFYICMPLSCFLMTGLIWWNFFPFLINIAFGVTPLLVVGVYAGSEENEVFRRDNAFTVFVRAFTGAMSVMRGGALPALASLRVHNFGVLNSMVVNAYRRLKLGSERFKSWLYFAGESGSNLIAYFSKIMIESIYMGGKPDVIGKIISKNFSRLLSLRKLRLQLASGLRGALYGALVGFVATIYIAAAITGLLAGMFGTAFESAKLEGSIGSIVNSIVPPIPEVNFELVNIYIGFMVLFHSITSAWIVKIVDGGYIYAIFFDLVLMIWLGALLSIGIPFLTRMLFGQLLLPAA